MCSLAWCLLRYATLHPGGASDELAIIAATLIAMAVDRAWAPATPRSPLREELSRALTHLLQGAEKLRPGALALLQVSNSSAAKPRQDALGADWHLQLRKREWVLRVSHCMEDEGLYKWSSHSTSMSLMRFGCAELDSTSTVVRVNACVCRWSHL